MSGNGQPSWGCAVQRTPGLMLHAALRVLARGDLVPLPLPACNGDAWSWIRRIAECLRDGRCRSAVVFCDEPALACCVANKVAGVRALAVSDLAQARRAVRRWGANLLAADMNGCTYFEFKELLHLASGGPVLCPPEVAGVLRELDSHAHR